MPVYNGMPYLRQAVESVLSQDLIDWELIIVNDGSLDATASYLDSLNDARVRVIHQANKGVSEARNVALRLASCDYITLLDADDALPPGSLRVRVDYLMRHSEVDIVDGCMAFYDADMSNILSLFTPSYRGDLLQRLVRLDGKVFRLPFYLFRRSLVGDILFKTGMTHAEDLLFFISLAVHQPVVYGYVMSPVYDHRTCHGSAMSNLVGLEEGYFTLIREVAKLPLIKLVDRLYLRLRVARILLLSWGQAGNWLRGGRCAIKLLMRFG